jgi:predicted RNA-binding protein associated with RNAse of E/G family
MVPLPTPPQKLAQLKAMLQEGLITPAQYQKASQEVLNQYVQ